MEQFLASSEIQARGRLVEQEQLRVGHDRTSDLNALLLTVAEIAEAAGLEMVELPFREHPLGATDIDLFVGLVPATGDRVGGGQHHIQNALVRRDAAGHRGGRETDTRPQLEDVDPAERVIEKLCLAGTRVNHGGGNLQERGLARSVGTQDDPSVVSVDRPVDRLQNRVAFSNDGDIGKLEDAGHVSTLPLRGSVPC